MSDNNELLDMLRHTREYARFMGELGVETVGEVLAGENEVPTVSVRPPLVETPAPLDAYVDVDAA